MRIVWDALALGLAIVGLLFMVEMARADGESSRGDWFKSLQSPYAISRCCDLSDGQRATSRLSAGQWYVLDREGEWLHVDPRAITEEFSIDPWGYVWFDDGPYYSEVGQIKCFVRPGFGG